MKNLNVQLSQSQKFVERLRARVKSDFFKRDIPKLREAEEQFYKLKQQSIKEQIERLQLASKKLEVEHKKKA